MRVVRPVSPARQERAVIYVPKRIVDPVEFAAVVTPCVEHCEGCSYEFVGIVRTWSAVEQLFDAGQADVAVVSSRGHLPRDRPHRVEAADEPIPTSLTTTCVVGEAPAGPRRRRGRVIR